MVFPEHKSRSVHRNEISCEKSVEHLCRKLLRWYEKVLPHLPRECDRSLSGRVVIAAALFILREKRWIADHRFFVSCKLGTSGCAAFSSLHLPGAVQKLDLFAADSFEPFPSVPETHWNTLASILSSSVPQLMRQDPSAEWLGRIFEVLLTGERSGKREVSSRKRTGSFYTPHTVVSCMVREALIRYFCTAAEKMQGLADSEETFRRWIDPAAYGKCIVPEELIPYRRELLDLLKGCRLLDPSCGSGFFLLEGLRFFLRLWESLETTDPVCREETLHTRGNFLLQKNLCGMDIQRIPLQIAQFCFLLALSGARPCFLPEKIHLFCCNAVLESPGELEKRFDIVIGNPPYVAIPGIPPEERALYQKNCRFARGRFNLFYLFLEKSQFWMKKNACSVLLVPDRVLLNTQCGSLRDFLLEQMDLFLWISFEKPLFRSASVDPVILGYCSREPSDGAARLIRCRKNAASETLHLNEYQLLSPGELCSSSRNGAEEKIFALREKIRRKSSLVLGDMVTIRDGIIQGSVGEALFLKGPRQKISAPPEECFKLLFGRNISPYRISFQENYVHYNIPLMKALDRKLSVSSSSGLRMRKKEIFLVPKILSRQTADGIIAALDENGEYFYANTLHGSEIIPACGYDLHFVLGIMNSTLATFLYRSESMEQGKTFAQIKIALLKALPVPAMEKKDRRMVSALVQEILSLSADGDPSSLAGLRSQINTMIYTFYGLTPDEIRLVESADLSVMQ